MRNSNEARCLIGALLMSLSIGVAAAETPTLLSKVDAAQTIQFRVYLPLKNRDALDQLVVQQHTPGSPSYHKWLTPAQFHAQFGARPEDVSWTAAVMANHNLTVTATKSRAVMVRGSVGDVQKTFNVSLWNAVTSRGHGTIVSDTLPTMPSELLGTGAKVVGISPHVIESEPHSRSTGQVAANYRSFEGPYYVDDLKQAYDFPSYQALNGQGVAIAIMGGADVSDADVATYFGTIGLPVPTITRFTVDGATLGFDPTNGDSFEAALDVQQAGGMAPNAHLYMYVEPNNLFTTELDAFFDAVDDDIADVITNSYGQFELAYTAQYADELAVLLADEDIYAQGNAQGITFVNSSGDHGAKDLAPLSYFSFSPVVPYLQEYWQLGPDYPSTSPHVTAVGGTNLVTNHIYGSFDSTYIAENANGDPEIPYDAFGVGNILIGGVWGSGGGVSKLFVKPDFQQLVPTGQTYRTVPDISGHMGGCPGGLTISCPAYLASIGNTGDARSSDFLRFNGFWYGAIGTSASAPDFAGLLALKIQHLCQLAAPVDAKKLGIFSCGGSRLGNENYEIYRLASGGAGANAGIFRPNIPGNNGYFVSGPGTYFANLPYNMVVGVGTVDARKFIGDLSDPPAGTPRTASNP